LAFLWPEFYIIGSSCRNTSGICSFTFYDPDAINCLFNVCPDYITVTFYRRSHFTLNSQTSIDDDYRDVAEPHRVQSSRASTRPLAYPLPSPLVPSPHFSCSVLTVIPSLSLIRSQAYFLASGRG